MKLTAHVLHFAVRPTTIAKNRLFERVKREGRNLNYCEIVQTFYLRHYHYKRLKEYHVLIIFLYLHKELQK